MKPIRSMRQLLQKRIDKANPRRELTAEEAKRLATLEGITDKLKCGENVQNRQLKTWLSSSAFTDLGLDLAALKAVVVKSSQHFYAGFESIAAEIIYIKGPGAITPDYTIIPFTKCDDRYWPKTENPFATK